MRVLVDPETGERVEVLPENTAGVGAYDLPQFRRAVMGQTLEKRGALAAYEKAVHEKAEAEGWYRRCLAVALVRAEAEHGKTNAQAHAKGSTEVVEAKERVVAAEGMERAARERLALCGEDRASLHRLGEWSAQQERFGGGSGSDPEWEAAQESAPAGGAPNA
jgi:hypothetical protein